MAQQADKPPADDEAALSIRRVEKAEGLEEIRKALSPPCTVGIDFETTGLDPLVNRIRLVQIACRSEDGCAGIWVIDAFKVGGPALQAFLVELFAKEGVVKVIHHAKFEISFLRQFVGHRLKIRKVFDTMLASQLITAGYFTMQFSKIANEYKRKYPAHKLADLARRLLGKSLDKVEQTSDWSVPDLTEAQIHYAALDAAILLDLYQILAELIKRNHLNRVAAIEFAALPAVVEKELRGLPFDAPRARALLKELEAELGFRKTRLDEAVLALGLRFPQKKHSLHKVFNPMSLREVRRIFKTMGIALADNRDETLQALASSGNAFAGELAVYRKIYKQTGFVKGWLLYQHPADDRIHTNYVQIHKNNTGRFSSRSPNLQQIPGATKFRSLFKAPSGRKIIDADYAAVELRIAAAITGETRMIKAFQEGADLHRQTAAIVSGKSPDEISKIERNQAKATNFGLIYGCGANTLTIQARSSYGVEITLAQAERFRNKFFEHYPRIREYHRKRCRPEHQVTQHWRYTPEKGFYAVNIIGTRTLSGRLRIWPTHRGETQARFTDLANTPVQGTGADILKIALARVYEALRSKGWDDVWLIGSTHDEIMLEAPEDKAEEVAELLVAEMQAAGAELIMTVPIVTEVEILDSLPGKG